MATKLSKGKYRSQVLIGTENGKRKYKSFYADTAKEADYLALQYKFEEEQKTDPKKITLGEAIDRHISSKEGVISPTTIRGYKAYRKNRFQDIMGTRIADLTKAKLQEAVDAEAKEVSAKTVKNGYELIRVCIRKYRPKFDPNVSLPAEPHIEYATPDGELLKKIFDAAKGHWLELPIMLSAWLSLRRSEILGLKLEDVFDDYIYVRRARVYDDSEMVEKGTKNYTSTRKIPLPPYIKQLIVNTPKTSQYIVDQTGNRITKGFSSLLKKHNLPHCRFHDLRHANASIMVMLGVPDKYAQARGGWANGTVLSKRYQQTFEEEEIRIANTIDSYFFELLQQ